MTERRWKFSQIVSLAFVGLLLVAAFVGFAGADDGLLSDSVIQPPVALGSAQ